LPEHVNSNDVGRRMKQSGYILSYQSDYLLKKNWIQISLMGECSRDDIAPLIDLLDDYVFAETPRHR
jgi:predicted DNA-binding protein (MmcQ/YjbR family)